jgi:hypothetical protein
MLYYIQLHIHFDELRNKIGVTFIVRYILLFFFVYICQTNLMSNKNYVYISTLKNFRVITYDFSRIILCKIHTIWVKITQTPCE